MSKVVGFLEEVDRKPVPDEDRPQRCEKCPYPVRRTCGSRGPRDSRIVVVAESPGDLEERYGYPLIGPSGNLLSAALPEGTPEILYLNAIQCFPGHSGQKNQNTLANAVFSCQDRLFEEILEFPRDLILVLGKYAAISMTGNPKVAITKIRGTTQHIRYGDQPLAKNGVFFSVHPSFLLHGGENSSLFYGDIKRAIIQGTALEDAGEGKKQIKSIRNCVLHLHILNWLRAVCRYDEVAADIETTGFNHQTDRILWLGAYGGDDKYHVIRGENLKASVHAVCREEEITFLNFRDWNKDKTQPTKFIWQNGKFDVKFLRRVGLILPVDIDTMLMSYVLNEQQGNHDLDSIALHYCDLEPHKDMVAEFYKKGRTLADAPEELVLDYLGRDLRSTKLVEGEMRPLIAQDKSNTLLEGRLIRAGRMLASVERHGMLIDWGRLERNFDDFEGRLGKSVRALVEMSNGYVDNPNSSIQVQDYLFNRLGMPRIAQSSDKETLERLLDMKGPNAFIELLLEHRRDAKLFGTYIKNIPALLGPDDRIHATYNIHGTVTGRLSSSGPNMQNIPREGRIRSQFRSSEDRTLMGIDLNQAELRVLACLSGDERLCEIYNDPLAISLHDRVAEELFGHYWDATKEAKVENKIKSKAVNFGIIYGRTASDIAREHRVPLAVAQGWLDWWYDYFWEARDFILRCRGAALKEQSLVTPFGRRKRPKVVSHRTKHNIENQLANFPPQSIASDLILDATTIVFERHQIYESTAHKGWDICNLIHDESLFDIQDDIVLQRDLYEEFSELIEELAWYRGLTQVPFVCEAKVGTHWGEMKELDWKYEFKHAY